MTNITKEEWQQLLEGFPQQSDLPSDICLELDIGGPEIDLSQAEALPFFTAKAEPVGSPTTDTLRVLESVTKQSLTASSSTDDIHLLVQKLQFE